MTAWRGKGVPDWEQLQSKAEAMWQKPSWAKGVLVNDASSAPGSRELFRIVQVTHHPMLKICCQFTLRHALNFCGEMYCIPAVPII